ncbi:isoprenylcysteine carboxylmethyltransferase family protein [Candidatus Omnitrophota bacterium]
MGFYKSIFIFVFSCAAIERIISTFKEKKTRGEIKYRWTTCLLVASYLFCILFALLEFIGKESMNYAVSIVGIFVAGIGIVLRKASIKALGDFWSIHIKVFDEQYLIKTGPYKFFRHPYSVAVILELIGVSLFFNAFFAPKCPD